MNLDNEHKQLRNDEIDLGELLLTLWQGKWIIICITSMFFSFGLIYISFFQTQTATFDIEPIASYEIEHYAELNYLLKQAELAELTPDQQAKFLEEKLEPSISAQVLVDLLMERVRNRQDFLQAVKELNFIPQGNKTEEEWALAIRKFVYNIQFLRPASKEELAKNKSTNARLNWQIKTEDLREQIQYKQLLELTLKKSNEFVREGLLNKVEQKITLLKNKQEQDIEDIDIKIKGLREDYKAKVANRIAYLKEQAQIARQLGIAKSTIEAQSFNGSTVTLAALQTETPFYLRGYEAIEKELNLLETRTSIDEFIPELIGLNQERRAILDDQLPQRLKQALSVSNIAMKEIFMSAMIDMDEAQFEFKPKAQHLLFILVILGVFLGVLIVLIKNILISVRYRYLWQVENNASK